MAITITKVEDLVKKAVTNDMKRLAQKVKASETKPVAPQRPTTPHVVRGPLPMGVTIIRDFDDDYCTATPPSQPKSTPQPTTEADTAEAATIEVSTQTEPPTSKKKKKGKKHREAKHKEHRQDRAAQPPIEIHIHLHLP